MSRKGERITIREVARTAGVSVGTASRVLNRNATVGPEISASVQRAIETLGYRPNAVAQSMRSRSTHIVGCVIREINIPQLAAFVRAAHDVFDEAGLSLLLSNSEGRHDRERELLLRLSRQQADGILVGPYATIDAEYETFLRGLDVPIVLVDRDQPQWADAVMADHRGGVRVAASHLLRLGHRRILLLTGEPDLYPARARIEGFKQAFAAYGLAFDPQSIRATSFLAAVAFRSLSPALDGLDRPTAIIAGGIDLLPVVLRAVRMRGLKIPQDISVVAAGDSELAQLYEPAISVQQWDQGEVGRTAASLLISRMADKADTPPQHVLLPSEFILRGSIAPPVA